MPSRCDDCGRFAARLRPVWTVSSCPSIDREVCDRCHALTPRRALTEETDQ